MSSRCEVVLVGVRRVTVNPRLEEGKCNDFLWLLKVIVSSNVVFYIYSKAENEHMEKMKVRRSSCVKPPSEQRESLALKKNNKKLTH